MSTYSYLRVSTDKQELNHFKAEILNYANNNNLGHVEFVEEIVSSTKDWRKRELGTLLLKKCEHGSVVIVSELSRISRSIPQIYEILTEAQKRDITMVFLKQNLVVRNDNDIATKVMLSTMSLCAEIEKSFVSLRTKEALKAKKAQGIKLGRPKGIVGHSKLDKHGEEIKALRSNGATLTFIANKFSATPITVSNWLKKHPLVEG